MKRILTLASLMFALNSSIAQENWLFMPTLGVNSTPMELGGVTGTSHYPGILIGFMASNSLEEHWSLDYGITVNQRYSYYTISEESSQLEDLINLPDIPILNSTNLTIYENTSALSKTWTIDIPLTATYKFNNNFLLFGGGFVNYLLSARTDTEKEVHIPVFEFIPPEELPIDQDLLAFLPKNGVETSGNSTKDGFRDLGFGLLFGLGYQSENWTFKLGYHWGLNDIRDDLDEIDMNIKNQQALTLSLAYNVRNLFETSKQKPKYDLELIE